MSESHLALKVNPPLTAAAKRLGDLCVIRAGGTPQSRNSLYYGGEIPWCAISDITAAAKYIKSTHKTITQEGLANSSAKIFPKGTLLLSIYASLGEVTLTDVPMATNQAILGLRAKDPGLLSMDYLYYVMQGARGRLVAQRQSGSQHNLNRTIVSNFTIPVPPLEVQREIVRILDTFTELEEELEAELEARRHQYQHYRDTLLSFDHESHVRWEQLGELGSLYGGLSGKGKADFGAGDGRYITFVNVFRNPRVDLAALATVRIAPSERQNAVQLGDVLFTASSENPEEVGMSSVVSSVPEGSVYLNSFCFGLRQGELKLEPDFAKHLFRSNVMRRQIERTASGVTRFNVSKDRFKRILVPVPVASEQQNIATQLDAFETLVNDPSIGLPAELAARRKQYEYYRDRLLTFEEAV